MPDSRPSIRGTSDGKAGNFIEGLDLVLSIFGAGDDIFGFVSPDTVGPKLDEILDGIDDIKATLDDLEESILAELDLIRDAAITSALADSLAFARGGRTGGGAIGKQSISSGLQLPADEPEAANAAVDGLPEAGQELIMDSGITVTGSVPDSEPPLAILEYGLVSWRVDVSSDHVGSLTPTIDEETVTHRFAGTTFYTNVFGV